MNNGLNKSILITLFLLLFVIPVTGHSIPADESNGFELTYIANDGVLISWKDKQVLIDGLFRDHHEMYSNLTGKTAADMEAAQSPFNNIDVILVTHKHLDHFHPVSIGRHLKGNSQAVMISNKQVTDELKQGYSNFGSIRSQVKTITPSQKIISQARHSGITVEILKLAHVNGARFADILNNGYIVNLNGKKFFHSGDAAMNESNLKGFDLEKKGIHMAFIPYWELLSPRNYRAVKTYLNPERIVALHIPPKDSKAVKERLAILSSEIIPLTELLKKRKF